MAVADKVRVRLAASINISELSRAVIILLSSSTFGVALPLVMNGVFVPEELPPPR